MSDAKTNFLLVAYYTSGIAGKVASGKLSAPKAYRLLRDTLKLHRKFYEKNKR
jgi:hypothetical protein